MPSTHAHDFAYTSHNLAMLRVREGIPMSDALVQALDYLKSANASNEELNESIPIHNRVLSRATSLSVIL